MTSRFFFAALLTFLSTSPVHARTAPGHFPETWPETWPEKWQGEWSHWTKKGASFSGANLRVKTCKDSVCPFEFKSEDTTGKTCDAEGDLKVAADGKVQVSLNLTLKKKAPSDCELALEHKEGEPATLHAEFKGASCKQLCTSPKALALPDLLTQVSATPSLDPLTFPQCETSPTPALLTLCYDSNLANSYLKAVKTDDRARALQQTFYVSKEAQVPAPSFFWETCTGDDAKDCVTKGVKDFADSANRDATRIQKLKNQLDTDLKSTQASGKAKTEVEALKGKYKKKIKSGTMSGDKFEVTNDMTIENDEGDLAFDVLLNFFDEQECTISGSAQVLKNGRFLYKEGGSSCRLLIFKEGDDLVLTDEPPNSCRKHCGKGASLFNARFPLSSRSTK